MAQLRDETRTTRFRVRVSPGASRSTIVGRHGTAWKIRIAARPERGRANNEVVDLLARTLGLSTAQVALVGGLTGKDKLVEIRGIEAGDADRLLQTAAEESR